MIYGQVACKFDRLPALVKTLLSQALAETVELHDRGSGMFFRVRIPEHLANFSRRSTFVLEVKATVFLGRGSFNFSMSPSNFDEGDWMLCVSAGRKLCVMMSAFEAGGVRTLQVDRLMSILFSASS